jgi:hypothetical protein
MFPKEILKKILPKLGLRNFRSLSKTKEMFCSARNVNLEESEPRPSKTWITIELTKQN